MAHPGVIGGLARYSVHSTATALLRLLHHFFIRWTTTLRLEMTATDPMVLVVSLNTYKHTRRLSVARSAAVLHVYTYRALYIVLYILDDKEDIKREDGKDKRIRMRRIIQRIMRRIIRRILSRRMRWIMRLIKRKIMKSIVRRRLMKRMRRIMRSIMRRRLKRKMRRRMRSIIPPFAKVHEAGICSGQ